MIRLKELLKEESFTATNKKTGNTSVFKSKDSRDSAIKAGTHTAKDKSQAVSKSNVKGVNAFVKNDKTGEAPKVNPNLKLTTKKGKNLETAIQAGITKYSKNSDFEKSGPYTILAKNGDKINANSKRIDNVDDLTQSYDKMRSKYDKNNTIFIQDGWGRTVFFE